VAAQLRDERAVGGARREVLGEVAGLLDDSSFLVKDSIRIHLHEIFEPKASL
jgi:hypothetical protein